MVLVLLAVGWGVSVATPASTLGVRTVSVATVPVSMGPGVLVPAVLAVAWPRRRVGHGYGRQHGGTPG